MATTAACTSMKSELMSSVHCFQATQSGVSATGVSTQFTLTSIASTAALVVGMAVTGTNVAAGAVIASIDSASQVTLSKAHTGSVTTVTFTGDVFKLLLIKVSPTRTFDGTQTNVGTPGTAGPTATNVGTDECAATGTYVSGGTALTNASPTTSGTTAFIDFTVDPSYTSATISTTAGIIYSASVRMGSANGITANASGSGINRSISVHDFGGTQTVTSGTITFVFPTADSTNAILRIA